MSPTAFGLKRTRLESFDSARNIYPSKNDRPLLARQNNPISKRGRGHPVPEKDLI
jgi:hypothetical protein